MNSTLEDLADRVEKAQGPSRELDAEIAKAVGKFKPDSKKWRLTSKEHAIWHHFSNVMNPDNWSEWWSPEDYTGSIDAAMGLVPGGWKIKRISEVEGIIGAIRHDLYDCELMPVVNFNLASGTAILMQNSIVAASLRALAVEG